MAGLRSPDDYPLGDGKLHWTCTQWLEDNLGGDFVILDCQPNIHDYIAEHIPGSVYFPPELMRVSEQGIPGRFIPAQAAGLLFASAGVSKDTPVVVATGTGPVKGWGDGLEQTMIAYSLLRYGATDVWVLDGGIDAWKAEGRELSQLFPEIAPGSFVPRVQEDFFVTYEQFKAIKDDDDVMVLDARPQNVYEGQGPWRKPGHIPGAIHVPWRGMMHDDNPALLKTDAELQAILDRHGITEDKTVVCTCGTGREATNEFILLKYHLGFPKVRIYEGSFTEWCHYDEPTVTGPQPR